MDGKQPTQEPVLLQYQGPLPYNTSPDGHFCIAKHYQQIYLQYFPCSNNPLREQFKIPWKKQLIVNLYVKHIYETFA